MEKSEKPERPMNRNRRSRKKVCAFCVDKIAQIDYKDVPRLRRFLSERGKIIPRRVTGTCARPSSCVSALCCRLIFRKIRNKNYAP